MGGGRREGELRALDRARGGLRWIIAVGWTVVVFTLLWMPVEGPPSYWWTDEVVHFTLFGGFGGAWRWVYFDRPRAVIVAGLVVAAITEGGQGLLPWPRTPALDDLVLDILGLLIGTATARWIRL